MVTITSLYICISYIYTYSYNFYYLSSLHSYGMSIFSVTCSMSLHISYLYFYCIPVSILCIFHIHSITYCSIFMYCYHVLFMYCVHILFSWYTFHITFSCMYCTCSYTFRVLSYTFLYNRVSSYFVLYYSCTSLYFHLVIFIDYTFL